MNVSKPDELTDIGSGSLIYGNKSTAFFLVVGIGLSGIIPQTKYPNNCFRRAMYKH